MSQAQLKKTIGLWPAVSIIIGSIIGSGVFMKPATMAAQVGSPLWMTAVWIVAGVFSLIGALIYAEVGAMLPETGGQYVYFRHMYGRKEVHKVEDIKGYKVRVQATATEDTMFAAYGAQTVHMPFGSVYTSLQTGVVDFAENAVNVYLINKHYEVAPVLSMTEHEANNAIMWISDKLWQSLNAEQKQWVMTAARDVSVQEPKRAFELERAAAGKLEKMGVKIVRDVDKPGFQNIADPYLDKLARELGPHADKIKTLIRAIN